MVNITKSPIYMKDIRIKSILVDFALSLISDFWKFSILHRTLIHDQCKHLRYLLTIYWFDLSNLFNLITSWTVDGNAVEKYDNWCNTAEIQCVQFLNVYIYFHMYRVYTWYYVADTWHVHVFICLTFRNVQVLDLVEVALCKWRF